MVNIVHIDTHFDDKRNITAIDIKLKLFEEGDKKPLSGHELVATISAAFFKTTLLTDAGKALNIVPNPDRHDIVDLSISLRENDLAFEDIAKFATALQNALDDTSLF